MLHWLDLMSEDRGEGCTYKNTYRGKRSRQFGGKKTSTGRVCDVSIDRRN